MIPSPLRVESFLHDAGDDLVLGVTRTGDGPPLVMVHGFTGSAETWAPFRAPLAAHLDTIAVDAPGHGRSSAPRDPSRYALPRFASDLRTLLDALDVERAAILGYSMGGRAALRFALDHADRVAALVLESASPGIASERERADRLAGDEALAAEIETGGVTVFIERWERLPLWANEERSVDVIRRAALRAQRLANDPHGLANSLRGAGAGHDAPVLDRLGEIRAPTLLVAGAMDAKYVAHVTAMRERIAGSTVEIVPASGHAVHFEQPAEFVSRVQRFLARVPTDGLRWL